jgi:hypothetical protein
VICCLLHRTGMKIRSLFSSVNVCDQLRNTFIVYMSLSVHIILYRIASIIRYSVVTLTGGMISDIIAIGKSL